MATGARAPAAAARRGGYAALRAYAPIGDGRSVALVSDGGSIDWLAWPDLDSPSVFAALLDAGTGGSCVVAPTVPFTVSRRYLPATNVLETTFLTRSGAARVLDALTLRGQGLGPSREVQRRVEGVSGAVPMQWAVRPRFGYGQRPTRLGWRSGVPVATCGSDALAVCSFDAGTPVLGDGAIHGSFSTSPGSSAVVALCGAHQEPLVFPTRAELDRRLDGTISSWRGWADSLSCQGPWRDAVLRSALTLKLLVYAPSGALAAAATTSLPEEVGGERNWDYRFCWVRDAAFILDALLRLGCAPEAEAYFWWLLQATQLTHPRLQPLYRLDGGARMRERVLALAGYQGSRPVRAGTRRLPSCSSTATASCWSAPGSTPRPGPDRRGDRPPAGGGGGPGVPPVARARRRDLGGAQRAPALHPLEDDVLGCSRPSRPAGRPRTGPPPARRALAF